MQPTPTNRNSFLRAAFPPLMTRIPFAFARSALFRPGHSGEAMTDANLPAAQDYAMVVKYSGPALTPTHALIWQALVAFAYKNAPEEGVALPLEVREIDLLKACGRRSMQANARNWLWSHVHALGKAEVIAVTPQHKEGNAFQGRLIQSIDYSKPGIVAVTFAQGLKDFLAIEYVAVPVASKARLIAHPLAAWAADYIATHKSVYRVDFRTLRRLTGSTLAPEDFRKRFLAALKKIETRKTLLHYSVEDDILTLHKARTRVVLPRSAVITPKAFTTEKERRIHAARMQRIKTTT